MTEALHQQTEQSKAALALAGFRDEISNLKKEIKDKKPETPCPFPNHKGYNEVWKKLTPDQQKQMAENIRITPDGKVEIVKMKKKFSILPATPNNVDIFDGSYKDKNGKTGIPGVAYLKASVAEKEVKAQGKKLIDYEEIELFLNSFPGEDIKEKKLNFVKLFGLEKAGAWDRRVNSWYEGEQIAYPRLSRVYEDGRGYGARGDSDYGYVERNDEEFFCPFIAYEDIKTQEKKPQDKTEKISDKETEIAENVEPIYVTDPESPELLDYQDSLFLWKHSNIERVKNLLNQGFISDVDNTLDPNHDGIIDFPLKHKGVDIQEMRRAGSSIVEYPGGKPINNNGLYRYEESGDEGKQTKDLDAEKEYFYLHKKILPIGETTLHDFKERLAAEYMPVLKEQPGYKADIHDFIPNPNYTGIPALDFNGKKIVRNFITFPIYAKPTQLIFLEGTQEADAAHKQQELKKAGFKIEIDGRWGKKSQAMREEYQRSKAMPSSGEEEKTPAPNPKSEEEPKPGILKENQGNEGVTQKDGVKAGEDAKTEKERQSTESIEPIYVTDSNDPRLQDYKYNLALYDYSNELKKLVKRTKKDDPYTFVESTFGRDFIKGKSKAEIAKFAISIYKRDEPVFDALIDNMYEIQDRMLKVGIASKRSSSESLLVIMNDKSAIYEKTLTYFAKPTQLVFLEGTPEADAAKKQQELKKAGFKIEIDGRWGKKSQAMREEYQRSKVIRSSGEEKRVPAPTPKSEEEPKPAITPEKVLKPDTDKTGMYMMPDGKRYSKEYLVKTLGDSAFKANFPNSERPKEEK